MPAPFTFDRSWWFDCPPERLWEVVSRTEDYPSWWSWLDRFECDGLHEGARSRFTVRPPLPYRLRIDLEVTDVRPGEVVATCVGGDLSGRARLELVPAGRGTEVRLVWSLVLRRPMLVATERVARPAMVWGHDRIVAIGVEQFRRRALGGGVATRRRG